MSKRNWLIGFAGASLSAGLLFASPGIAQAVGTSGASGPSGVISVTTSASGSKFLQAKLSVESALTKRQGQLVNLTAQVNGAVNLSSSDKATLLSRLGVETTNINGLIAKVPSDTTWKSLDADSNAMYRDNRVFAVMTPQSHDSIVANNNVAMATTLTANELSMSAAITARAADAGYKAAMHEYADLVKVLADVHTNAGNVDTTVLAQTPAGYPANLHVFSHAATELNQQQSSLGHAASDSTSIELFIEAYPVA